MNKLWKNLIRAVLVVIIVILLGAWVSIYLAILLGGGIGLYALWLRRNGMMAYALIGSAISTLVGLTVLLILGDGPANPLLWYGVQGLAGIMAGFSPLLPIPPQPIEPPALTPPLIEELTKTLPPEEQQHCPNCEAVISRSTRQCPWCSALFEVS